MQGAAMEIPDGSMSRMTNYRAIVPVSLKVFLNMRFNLQAGVQGGYLLMATADKQNITDRISTLDMGFNLGLGIGTPSGMDFTLRYYSGMSNALKEDKSLYPTNRTLQLTIGHRFKQFRRSRLRHR
jgi:hypothetical protein